MNSRLVALTVTVLVLWAVPAAAQQATPSPTPAAARPMSLPSIPAGTMNVLQNIVRTMAGDATAGFGVDPGHVRGGVTFFQRFNLQIKLPLNQYKNVYLHQGTIINPRGATLQPGQTVDVRGRANADGTLNADEITILH